MVVKTGIAGIKKVFRRPPPIQWQIVDKDTIDEIIFRTTDKRNRLMLELMARGGMRVGEVLKLTPDGVIERDPIHKSVYMGNTLLTFDGLGKLSSFAILDNLIELSKQMSVVTRFCPKDKSHIVVDQISNMRAVGTKPILDHHTFQMGMILAELVEKSTGSFSLTVLLGTPILHDDHFRAKWKHNLLVWLEKSVAQSTPLAELLHIILKKSLVRPVKKGNCKIVQIYIAVPSCLLRCCNGNKQPGKDISSQKP